VLWRPPYGFGVVLFGFGSALATAAPPIPKPTAIAVLTSIFVTMWR
jgi:hypothetical protein